MFFEGRLLGRGTLRQIRSSLGAEALIALQQAVESNSAEDLEQLSDHDKGEGKLPLRPGMLSSTSSFENIWNSMAIVVRLLCWRWRLESVHVVHVVIMVMIRRRSSAER